VILGTIIYVLDMSFDVDDDEFPAIENVDSALVFDGELTRYVRNGGDLLLQNVPPSQEHELMAAIPQVIGNQFGGAMFKAIPAKFRGLTFVYVVAYS